MTATLSIARGEFADVLAAAGLDGSGRFCATLSAEALFQKPADVLQAAAAPPAPPSRTQLLEGARPLLRLSAAVAPLSPAGRPSQLAAARPIRPPLRFQHAASPPPPVAAPASADLKRRRDDMSCSDAPTAVTAAPAVVDEGLLEPSVREDHLAAHGDSLHERALPSQRSNSIAAAECLDADPEGCLRSARTPLQYPPPSHTDRAFLECDRAAHAELCSDSPPQLREQLRSGSPPSDSSAIVVGACASPAFAAMGAPLVACVPVPQPQTVHRPETSHSEQLRPASPDAAAFGDVDGRVPADSGGTSGVLPAPSSLLSSGMPRVSSEWASALEGLL